MEDKLIPLSRPWFNLNEFEGADKILESEWVISGPLVKKFEEEFRTMVGARYAIGVSTGSNGLWVAQGALGIQAGDEVLVPNMTFVTTATSLMLHGAKPVFVDIELDSYGMDPEKIEKYITPKTKGICPVHYAGQTAKMDRILEIAKKHRLFVLEDAAESHLAKYNGNFCGTIGDIGLFSFTPTKPITTGEGGMITTNDESLAKKCRLLHNIGDVGKFEWEHLGFNFRMPEIIALMGLHQIKRMEEFVNLRRENGLYYNEALAGCEAIVTPKIRTIQDHNFQLYTIRIRPELLTIGRDEFISEMLKRGVSGRLYYPCLHHQKVFARFERQRDEEFPNSRLFETTAISIPVYPKLSRQEKEKVVGALLDIASQFKR